ncbi:hypothetical protein MiSe_41040 [Microseira wollei NIES-4236]|uniref:Uncharacterized protein n=2 Tax=Microseira wollei TaxID=467598 RepID=A0AAV3XGT9_9CYAN|nr:hypothetical protein MiSe_41040 [Microseira wollei NIES-4236]
MCCPTPELERSKPCQTWESMPKGSSDGGICREEALVAALFQRLPKMLASLESFSEK